MDNFQPTGEDKAKAVKQKKSGKNKKCRKRLQPWLWKHTDAGDYGLAWVSKEERIFRIPWKKYKSPGWDDIRHGQVFKEWARVTGKYEQGDMEDYPTWKERIKNALTKLRSDFEELHEMHDTKDKENPYKVYRFKKADDQDNGDSTENQSQSPVSSFGNSKCVHNVNLDRCGLNRFASEMNQHASPLFLSGNIPKVLFDNFEETSATESRNETALVPDQQQAENCISNQRLTDLAMNDIEMPSLSSLNSNRLPSDLRSLDSGNLAIRNELSSNEIAIYKNDQNLNKNEVFLSRPAVLYELYYFDEIVTRGCLYSDKLYHFYYGKIPDKKFKLSTGVFGPDDAERIPLPNIRNMNRKINSKQEKILTKCLLETDRGFALFCQQGDIHIQRYCRVRLFATSPTGTSQSLDRQSEMAIKVFDLKHYTENQLDPKTQPPIVNLTFAQDLRTDTFKRLPIVMVFTSLEANPDPTSLTSINYNSGLQFSNIDSKDLELREHMNALCL